MLFPLVLGQGIKRDLERDSGTHSCSSLLWCKSWSLHDYCDFLQGAGCCWVEFGKSYLDPPAYRVQRSGEGFLCNGPSLCSSLLKHVSIPLQKSAPLMTRLQYIFNVRYKKSYAGQLHLTRKLRAVKSAHLTESQLQGHISSSSN